MRGQLLRSCGHDSADGVDAAPLGDPNKVWCCHECRGFFQMFIDERGISHVVELPEQAVACEKCTQGVLDLDRYNASGERIAVGNDHFYGRCICLCHGAFAGSESKP